MNFENTRVWNAKITCIEFEYRFPKDKKVCREWVKACKRRDKFSTESYRVCSIHFDKEDYERDLKAELLK